MTMGEPFNAEVDTTFRSVNGGTLVNFALDVSPSCLMRVLSPVLARPTQKMVQKDPSFPLGEGVERSEAERVTRFRACTRDPSDRSPTARSHLPLKGRKGAAGGEILTHFPSPKGKESAQRGGSGHHIGVGHRVSATFAWRYISTH